MRGMAGMLRVREKVSETRLKMTGNDQNHEGAAGQGEPALAMVDEGGALMRKTHSALRNDREHEGNASEKQTHCALPNHVRKDEGNASSSSSSSWPSSFHSEVRFLSEIADSLQPKHVTQNEWQQVGLPLWLARSLARSLALPPRAPSAPSPTSSLSLSSLSLSSLSLSLSLSLFLSLFLSVALYGGGGGQEAESVRE